jgi:phosphopantetheinyl transferase
MKLPPLKALIWPECPAGFDQNGLALVLLTLPAGTLRAAARSQARAVLRELAVRLLPGAPVELVESPRGPQLQGSDIRISLSYAGDKVLIGLSKRHALGVDIVQIDNIPEIGALSGLYLPDSAAATLCDENFALSWAQMEACCKALGLPLAEIDPQREKAYATCDLPDCEQIAGYRMAAAVLRSVQG